MELIPAIDLLNGRTVRLLHGDYDKVTDYDADPVEIAREFADAGASWIHLVDLNGAKSGEQVNRAVIEKIVRAVPAKLEVGGGVRSLETARELLELGVARVVFGTVLVKNPELAGEAFRALGERAVAGIDARDGMMATEGWLEGGTVRATDLAREMERAGARRFIVTDIATDGALTGPNFAFLLEMMAAVSVPIIASGGVSGLADLIDLAKMDPAPEAAIAGRAIYERKLDIHDWFSRV